MRNVHPKLASKMLTMMPPGMRNFSTVVNANGIKLKIFTGESLGKRMYYSGDFENTQVQIFLSLIGSDTVLYDIGANIGYYSILAASHGARIYSFEPCPEMQEWLSCNIELNHLSERITVVPEAVSGKEGTVTFYPHREGNFGVGKIFKSQESVNKKASAPPLEVRTRALDGYFQEFGMPTLIKMDIEGAEYFVINNLPESLVRDDAPTLFIEFHPTDIANLGGNVQGLRDKLKSLGYRRFQMLGGKDDERLWEAYSKTDISRTSLTEILN